MSKMQYNYKVSGQYSVDVTSLNRLRTGVLPRYDSLPILVYA